MIMSFGMYKGQTIQSVVLNNPRYLLWLYRNAKDKTTPVMKYIDSHYISISIVDDRIDYENFCAYMADYGADNM